MALTERTAVVPSEALLSWWLWQFSPSHSGRRDNRSSSRTKTRDALQDDVVDLRLPLPDDASNRSLFASVPLIQPCHDRSGIPSSEPSCPTQCHDRWLDRAQGSSQLSGQESYSELSVVAGWSWLHSCDVERVMCEHGQSDVCRLRSEGNTGCQPLPETNLGIPSEIAEPRIWHRAQEKTMLCRERSPVSQTVIRATNSRRIPILSSGPRETRRDPSPTCSESQKRPNGCTGHSDG